MTALLYLLGYGITLALGWLVLFGHRSAARPSETWQIALTLLFLPSLLKYALQLLIAPWFDVQGWWRRRRAPRRAAKPAQRVSVLVPAWNEEVGIALTVRSLLASDHPDVEVVVINDGSTDDTEAVMQALVAEHEASGRPGRLVYVSQPNGGKASALNRGLGVASGEIIVTTDADSAVAADTLTNFARRFDDPRVMAVAGNVKIGNRPGVLGLVQRLEYLYGFYFKKADSVLDSIYIVGGAAAAYRADVLHELIDRGRSGALAGFDEDNITEDIEMSTRLQAAGHRIVYAPDAVVTTEAPADWDGLVRQRLRWKFGRFLTFRQYRHLFFNPTLPRKRVLTMLILPVALLSEVLLLAEPLLVTVMWAWTIAVGDYGPALVYIGALTLVVGWQVLTDTRRRESLALLPLAPMAWLVFYLVDLTEFRALVRTLVRMATGRGVTWQRWSRQGVFASQQG
ncbi:glycosyltransferase [Aestuariimicrobium sp. T2.26MG-19.2B]|uniref:glycosyltransferase n=1 Tax=Aestuariimicrobium sp. T2.26MG-19.2B TaxID=3040679 RepID=UPI00247738A6|nr:glycosyltransferase family 2 protein [Aestuariimicrobium sp. T2.26MG-19.2B]CAI9407709.1 Undecaprenyl-phosphate 4-deoxy-4-formamido-L-arabinose transferase [Aestuariimicrobium sp. T2.26MG-19.2B]